jgi:secretion/DNA translocation related TadE-like protein
MAVGRRNCCGPLVTAREERGSATVHAALLVGLLATVALLATAIGSVLVGQRKAAAAADLAALAGAAAVQRGTAGCESAADIAGQNEARLVSCEVVGDVLTVQVVTEVRSLFRSSFELRARARAGPVVGFP